MGVLIKGIVNCIKHGPSIVENTYFVVHEAAGELTLSEFESKIELHAGEEIDIDMDCGDIAISSQTLGLAGKFEERLDKFAKEYVSGEIRRSGIADLDSITKKMEKKLHACARLLARKLLRAAPVIVRFHNDADGSSGAYALYKSLERFFENDFFSTKPRITWKMHRNVIYEQGDAEEDIITLNNYESVERPLLIVIDFGTSKGSNQGIERIGNLFDIVWLDHHPLEEDANVRSLENYVNPWNFGGESSYTAGFMACQFSKMFSDNDVACIEDASMIGDYSAYARNTDCGIKMAAVLDLLTSDKTIAFGTRNYLTPSEIDQVLVDQVKTSELFLYATSKMEDSLDSAIKSLKRYSAARAQIYVSDFDNVRDPLSSDRFPLPGRFASKLLSRIESDTKKPAIVILHFGRFISMRVSQEVSELVDVAQIARDMRENDDNVDSGGGHSRAASIKLVDGNEKKEIINSIINSLKEKLA